MSVGDEARPARPNRRCRSCGWVRPSLIEQLLEAVAVFGEVDAVGRGAEDRHAGRLERLGELQRRLAAELDDDAVQRAVLLLALEDLEHVLRGQRLEIEPVGGVVVGRDGLGLQLTMMVSIAGIAQREGGVAAAIVELDALADAVGAAAEDDDLLAVGGLGLVGDGRRRRASRRSSTCRRSARRTRRRRCRCACRPGGRRARGASSRDVASALAGQLGEARVGEAHGLELRRFSASSGRPCSRTRASVSTMPSIWRGTTGRSCRRRGLSSTLRPRRIACGDHAAGGRASACRARRGWRSCRRPRRGRECSISSRPVRPVSSERSAFCSDSWKVRPMAMASPTDFIAVVSVGVGAGELLEGEARDLGDDIVDGRLERGRGRAAGDVVVEFVERVADGELAPRPWRSGSRWPWRPAPRSARRAGSSR